MSKRLEDKKLTVSLFVVGNSQTSRGQIEAVKAIFRNNDYSRKAITVFDLLENPELAVANDILAIPTLIRTSPDPSLRIIGSMDANAPKIWDMLCS